ncbi:MAG: class I SAM-dependent methyltransferase [Candidatus Babeliales bacterium]
MDYKDVQAGNTSNYFWFKAKQDLISVLMAKACGAQTGLKILSLGAGTGDDLAILKRFGAVHVVDIDARALALIDDALCVEKRCEDACRLSYDNQMFDVVVACDVFEHILDDASAVAQAYRVLKKGGALIFTVPAHQWLFSAHDRALNHHRRYGKKTLNALMAPFASQKIFYWNSLLFPPIAAKRLCERWLKPRVNGTFMPGVLNSLGYYLLSLDNNLLNKNFSPPMGVSLVGYCRK